MEGKSMSNRFSQNIPNLGGVLTIGGQNSLNLSQTISADNEDMSVNGDRQSLIIRNNECVICMDNQRGKFLTLDVQLNLLFFVYH